MLKANKPVNIGDHIPYVICIQGPEGSMAPQRARHPDEVVRSNGELTVWYSLMRNYQPTWLRDITGIIICLPSINHPSLFLMFPPPPPTKYIFYISWLRSFLPFPSPVSILLLPPLSFLFHISSFSFLSIVIYSSAGLWVVPGQSDFAPNIPLMRAYRRNFRRWDVCETWPWCIQVRITYHLPFISPCIPICPCLCPCLDL